MAFRFPVKNHQGPTEGGRPAATARVSVFRRLLVRVTPAERLAADGKEVVVRDKDERPQAQGAGVGGGDAEVGSVALDRMVLSFMEDSAAVERPPRGRCNCFNGQDASDDEDFDFLPSSSSSAPATNAPADALELLKGLVQCTSTAERNLLADASRIAERCGKSGVRKKADVRRAVAESLRALGYDAAVCRSRWEKGASHPAGEHEYIDAVVAAPDDDDGPATRTRLVVEVDFRSEFEVARPTKAYRAALQALPPLFVGTPDRLGKVVAVVAEAARQSLRKRGLHFPPWRKPEYMRAKWLAPHARTSPADNSPAPAHTSAAGASLPGELELRFDDRTTDVPRGAGEDAEKENEQEKVPPASPSPSPWRPVEPDASTQSPRQALGKAKVVTGLASVL